MVEMVNKIKEIKITTTKKIRILWLRKVCWILALQPASKITLTNTHPSSRSLSWTSIKTSLFSSTKLQKNDQDLLNSGTQASERDHTDTHPHTPSLQYWCSVTISSTSHIKFFSTFLVCQEPGWWWWGRWLWWWWLWWRWASLPKQTKVKGCPIQSMTANKFWNCRSYPSWESSAQIFQNGDFMRAIQNQS